MNPESLIEKSMKAKATQSSAKKEAEVRWPSTTT
jgi:hypothetical protein